MTGDRPLVAWPPYVLMAHPDVDFDFPAGRSGPLPVLARPVLDAAGQDSGLYVWPILRVLGKMLDMAMRHMLIEKGIIAEQADQADQDEILQWVQDTRALAARWPFDPQKAEALRALASSIESTFTIAHLFPRDQWPRTAKRQQQFKTSMGFWALRTMLDALDTLDVSTFTFADLAKGVVWAKLPADKHTIFEKAVADGSLDRRVRDFRARQRPDAAGPLMAYFLHDTLLLGGDDCGRIHLPADPLPTQILH